MEITHRNENRKTIALNEDWVAVILAGIILGVCLSGYVLPVPASSWRGSSDLFANVLEAKNLYYNFVQFVFLFAVAVIGIIAAGKPLKNVLIVFPFIYVLTWIATIIAGNASVKSFNLEAVIFSLSIGLVISNTFQLPDWFRSALSTELFVKIGLVLLGSGVIFSDVLKAGSLGLIQALVVVVSVWYFAFWLCKRLGIDKELSVMISSAVSICGVSAAIATAGAIKGDSKKLSYVISLVLVTAIPMMIIMPYVANYFQFPAEVTGAWLGGSIDTTGAVVAAGSLVGETALNVSTIVKFSQNVLLGIAAFAISVYWTYSKKTSDQAAPTWSTIWQRFPKFVIGFVAASVLFSFFIDSGTIASIKDSIKNIQTFWFALAFTSIGLETRFSDLFNAESRKPLYAFLIAQGVNILITLILAFILFG